MIARRSLAALPLALAPLAARAQGAYPERPVRLVIGGAPGGAADVLARLVAERLAPRLGQPVTVENRPGAATNIAMQIVARAPADGHTLGLASIASNAVNRWMYATLPFNPDTDFAPVTLIATVPNLMVVPTALPVRNVAEFIAWARAQPRGTVTYGSIGAGSSQHLAGAQFALFTGIDMTHVPYVQSGQMNTDLMEGRIHTTFQSVSSVAELARAGRMRPLAASGTERMPAFPDVPTLREQGFDIVSMGWFGIVTPAGVAEPILERLHRDAVAALEEPALRERIIATGAIPRPMARAEFARFMAEETQRWRPVIEATGARVE